MRSCSDALYRCGSVMSSRSVMKAFPRLCLPVVNTQRLHIVGDIRNDKLVSQEKTYQQPCVGTLILSSTKSLSRKNIHGTFELRSQSIQDASLYSGLHQQAKMAAGPSLVAGQGLNQRCGRWFHLGRAKRSKVSDARRHIKPGF
ncbi:uncharacterized protein [Panulirus ornatus]|uniref:uncharacterized protein isoform X2 n=1 Tax=Panulirus ornatus TaxID=150431 RepID=UPI003A8AC7FD